MRQGLWGDAAKISGIECVGMVEEDPSGNYAKGQKVAAIMGGMGRTRSGSYAEMTCVPDSNIFPLETTLGWESMAAIPESYATAWSCLHENMLVKPGQSIFIRGGTSALGQAAINIASHIPDVEVMASTRSAENSSLLTSLGCSDVLIEDSNLSSHLLGKQPDGVHAVMDIVGNSTLLDSLKMVRKNGYVCNAGFLGGAEPFSFNPLQDMPSSVHLNFFASFMLGTENFPLSQIPMQQFMENAENGIYKCNPVRVFDFTDIAAAHSLMESNQARGKIVIKW
ncbi:MAG: zinc-binding dehydrogenase [gamma proteobacterium symbiont of Bathyaustriella thionipta]|nr:zinc-binding dehydrogenase [gamma proteobacterium symbiont of Bathyaustriella thionipta]